MAWGCSIDISCMIFIVPILYIPLWSWSCFWASSHVTLWTSILHNSF